MKLIPFTLKKIQNTKTKFHKQKIKQYKMKFILSFFPIEKYFIISLLLIHDTIKSAIS